MKKRISIGTQGFETLRNRDCFYVDKTDFIREWWESEAEVTLITRPRRFGKTLNMDTLNCFFSNHYKDRGELFEGLSIWKNEKYHALQGTYPVVVLSFADVKETTCEGAIQKIKNILVDLYMQYNFLKNSFSETSMIKYQYKLGMVIIVEYCKKIFEFSSCIGIGFGSLCRGTILHC